VDDLTAEAVASAFGRPLALDPVALEQIEGYFARRGSPMAAVNRKQALLPAGSERIDNDWGTAPGFLVQENHCLFVFLPGVPAEMKAMFAARVEPRLVDTFHLTPPRLVVLRTFGLGESALQQRLQPLSLPPGVRLGFRAGAHQNEIKLLFPSDCPAEECDRVVAEAVEFVGDAVFAIGDAAATGGSLADTVGALLRARDAALATAESMSGGQLAWLCRGQSWLRQSLVAPDVERLYRSLGESPVESMPDLEAGAARLAEAVRRKSGAEFGLAVLGATPPRAGDSWASPMKVALALAGDAGSSVIAPSLAGEMERRQIQAASAALNHLRRYLLKDRTSL
jgi:molybdopterin-biosynthesis enzyme MoeA-like protein